jgi:chromosome segregation ATPase
MSVSLGNSGVVLVKGTQLKTKPETVHHQVGGGFKSTAIREEFPAHLALSGKPQSPTKSKERPVSLRKEEPPSQLAQHRHKASPPPSPRPVKSSNDLETEYIHNLQQQVYLLETELKIVREKGASKGTAAGSSVVVRAGGDGNLDDDDSALPLQDILGQLRHRVRVQQTKLEQAMTAAEEAAQDFRSQRATLTLSIDNLEADKNDLIRHLEDMQGLHVADKERLAAQIVQLQRDNRALQMTVDKNSATEQRLNVERDELVQKNCLFERSVSDALRREKEARTLLSVSEENCGEALSSVERLKMRLQAAENDLVRFQSYVPSAVVDKLREQLRSAEMNLSNERTRATRLESEVNALRARNEAVQGELAEVREAARDAEKAFMKERETWNRDALQEQLVQLRVDNSKAKSDVSKLEARLQARVNEIDELHGQLAERQSRLIAASSVARQQTESAELEMREMVVLRKECGKLNEENMRVTSQVEGLLRSQTEREGKLSRLLREHAVAVTEAESSRKRLEKAKMLEQINPAQFEGLMQTNMQVSVCVLPCGMT